MKIYWIKVQVLCCVLVLVKYLGIDVQCIEVDIKVGGLKMLLYFVFNFNGKVFILVDGEVMLWELLVIMVYLCNKVGLDMWLVQQLVEQVEVLCWLLWSNSQWLFVVVLFYFEYVIKLVFYLGDIDYVVFVVVLLELYWLVVIFDVYFVLYEYVVCYWLIIVDFYMVLMVCEWCYMEMLFVDYLNIVCWFDWLMMIFVWVDLWFVKYIVMLVLVLV